MVLSHTFVSWTQGESPNIYMKYLHFPDILQFPCHSDMTQQQDPLFDSLASGFWFETATAFLDTLLRRTRRIPAAWFSRSLSWSRARPSAWCKSSRPPGRRRSLGPCATLRRINVSKCAPNSHANISCQYFLKNQRVYCIIQPTIPRVRSSRLISFAAHSCHHAIR